MHVAKSNGAFIYYFRWLQIITTITKDLISKNDYNISLEYFKQTYLSQTTFGFQQKDMYLSFRFPNISSALNLGHPCGKQISNVYSDYEWV